PLTLNGNGGSNALNVDDAGSTADKTGMLTATTLTGLGMAGGITYATLAAVNIYIGSAKYTLNIQSTSAITNVNGGPANDTFNVGSLMPITGGIVDGVAGPLTLIGNVGFNVLNVDDTGSTVNKTGTLTATTLTGLGMAGGITYATVAAVNI